VSVVRLELTVADDATAARVAQELMARYLQVGGPYTAATVDVRSNADATRDRVLLQAARYFLPEVGS
jgi:hypothetical protein